MNQPRGVMVNLSATNFLICVIGGDGGGGGGGAVTMRTRPIMYQILRYSDTECK